MSPIPKGIVAKLTQPPRVVVAPVSPGFGQEWLRAWAEAVGRPVIAEPESLGDDPALLLPSRRSQLEAIPDSLPLEELLVLDESSLLFTEGEWREELSGLPPELIEGSFEESGGWPAAIDLQRRTGRTELPLHRHPLARVAFERLLPVGDLRAELVRCAQAPVLLPDLLQPLGLDQELVDELADRGHLYPVPTGWAMPRPLRRYLAGTPEQAVALAIARLLVDRRHASQGLLALAEAGLWEEYLEQLALTFEPQGFGEARLRRALVRVPERLHSSCAYLYLLGSLERMRGDLSRAQRRYTAARQGAEGDLRGRIEGARGVVLALQGNMAEARRAFGAAVKHARDHRLLGEARHNRAGVFIRQGRYPEAERDLREAVANFREAADYAREARSLQLLALSWHRRGLLEEACRGYEDALELLDTLGQPTALLRNNLAEVLVLRGQFEEARTQLDLAAAEPSADARARGYLEVNRALLELALGDHEGALHRLARLLRQENLEANLFEEAELLCARALRQAGKQEEALEHALRAAEGGGAVNDLAIELELATGRKGELDEVIARARKEEARFELATALVLRGGQGDLEEALQLIRTHGFRLLVETSEYAQALARQSQSDLAAAELFPLRISTFGGFGVRFLGRTVTLADFPTRKSAALLIRLALSDRPIAREAIAEEFWGDAGNPLQSLQTALYHLGRTLGVQVVGGRKGTAELIYPVELDLVRFERAATAALDGSPLQGGVPLRSALSMVRGETLGEFPEWFEDERRHVESLQLRLWRQLAEVEAAVPARAAEALEGVLTLDPYDFASRTHLIGLYRELGESDLARRHEERRKTLESDL